MIEHPEDLLKLNDAQLLSTWVFMSNQLKKIKLLEGVARNLVVERFYDPQIKKGTVHADVGPAVLSAVKKLNYSLSSDKTEVEKVRDKLANYSEAGKLAAETVFKHKYELDTKVYEALPQELQNIVGNALVISNATPSLELKTK